MSNKIYNASVIVCSDTCSANPSLDTSGHYVKQRLEGTGLFQIVYTNIVQDDLSEIKNHVRSKLEDPSMALIITVGGTGPCPRDVTPEATSSLYEKHCSGVVAALHRTSLDKTPQAALSRLTAGIVKNCVIINFPGKKKACEECFDCIVQFLKHLLEQVRYDRLAIDKTHELQASNSLSKLAISCEIEPMKPADFIGNQSRYPLVNFYSALEILGQFSSRLYQRQGSIVELKTLEETQRIMGCTLAQDVRSNIIVPPFPVSMMDGFVVFVPRELWGRDRITLDYATVVQNLEQYLESERRFCTSTNPTSISFCYRVNTGNRVPDDKRTFAIVPVEDTLFQSSNGCDRVQFTGEIVLRRFIRESGSDIQCGDCILKDTKIGPIELGLILSMGHKDINLYKRPEIGLISTGDELLDPLKFRSPDSDAVFDINRPILYNLLTNKGFVVHDYGICRDSLNELKQEIQIRLYTSDVLVITGGASMGTKDYVKSVIEELGGSIHFGRVNMKPGKPMAFATINQTGVEKYVFSLPGNPVSAYITALTLVLPFLQNSCSLDLIGDVIDVRVGSILGGEPQEFDGRLEFLRAKLKSDESVVISVKQQSSRLMSLKDCNCLVIIPSSCKGSRLEVGQTYKALRLHN